MELILQRWLETLSLEERNEHPLCPYVLGHDFVRSAEGLSNLVRDRLAYVCAMIVCKRVESLAALALSPYPPTPTPTKGRFAQRQPVGVAVQPDAPGLTDSTGSR